MEYTYRLGDMQLSPDMVGYLMPGAASSCASPNAAAVSCGCSTPTSWRTWSTPGDASRGCAALPHRKADERRVAVSRQP